MYTVFFGWLQLVRKLRSGTDPEEQSQESEIADARPAIRTKHHWHELHSNNKLKRPGVAQFRENAKTIAAENDISVTQFLAYNLRRFQK